MFRKSTSLALSAVAIGLAVCTPVSANLPPRVIQPTDAESKDTFVYSFLPTFNFNAPQSGFHTIIAAGRSTSGHDLRGLVQFDLSGVTMAAGEIATLNLFVADGGSVGFPVANPSSTAPVTTEVYGITSAWDASSVNWNNQPPVSASPIDIELVDGIGRYIAFDVTAQVETWLANPAGNFGFELRQRDVVLNGGSVQAVFHSSANANRPFLYVGEIPEPATAVAMTGLLGIGISIRRRRS